MCDDLIVDLRRRDDSLITVSKLFADAYQAQKVLEDELKGFSRYSEILSDYFGLERSVPKCCVPGLRI